MKNNDDLLQRLEQHKTKAPEGFTHQVMDALPAWKKTQKRSGLHQSMRWLIPALTGAAAMYFIMISLRPNTDSPQTQPKTVAQTAGPERIHVYFELHAPGADQVELLGTFNHWKSGDIVLDGPNETGLWTATVELPEGRHEYIFLVDGERWLADPKSAALRPDGFGNVNTVIQVYDEDNV